MPDTSLVDSLLTLGSCDFAKTRWRDYRAMGLGPQHEDALIAMATDIGLNTQSSEPQCWAPTHAWRALAQLRAAAAVEPLLAIMDALDEVDDDWSHEDLPIVFAQIGAPAVPALAAFLIDETHRMFPRIAVARALMEIGGEVADARPACIAAITETFCRYKTNPRAFNTFLAGYLADLYVPDAIPLIRRAHASGRWDDTIDSLDRILEELDAFDDLP
jgi:hypothetical protein